MLKCKQSVKTLYKIINVFLVYRHRFTVFSLKLFTIYFTGTLSLTYLTVYLGNNFCKVCGDGAW